MFLFVAEKLLNQVLTVVGHQQPRPTTVVKFQSLPHLIDPGVDRLIRFFGPVARAVEFLNIGGFVFTVDRPPRLVVPRQPFDGVGYVAFALIEFIEGNKLVVIGPTNLQENAETVPAGVVAVDPSLILNPVDDVDVRNDVRIPREI